MADARQKTFHLSALLVFLRNLLEEFGPEKIGKANINIYFTWLKPISKHRQKSIKHIRKLNLFF